ncbi:MAG: hypothetical protein WCK75_10060 [Elusimicrobiota bacterium]
MRSPIAAVLAVIFAIGAIFANTGMAASPAASSSTTGAVKANRPDSIQTVRMKNTLSKLIRQDDFLDEALETLESANGKLSAHNMLALGLSFKIIKSDLDAISALNKKEFSEVQPEPGATTYTKTILSYSRSISQKIIKISGLVAKASRTNKKLAMRDAVISPDSSGSQARGTGRPPYKKTGNGKKLTQILEEQKAVERLSSDIQILKTASRQLNATSKWLYIVSK